MPFTGLVPLRLCRFGSRQRCTGPPLARTFSRAAPAPLPSQGRIGDLPGSCRTSVSPCPALRPRRVADTRLLRHRPCCLPLRKRCRPREQFPFGAELHGLEIPCVRFAARVTPAPRNTRFRLVANLCRAGLPACQVPPRDFHHVSPYITSLSSRLCLAHSPRRRPLPHCGTQPRRSTPAPASPTGRARTVISRWPSMHCYYGIGSFSPMHPRDDEIILPASGRHELRRCYSYTSQLFSMKDIYIAINNSEKVAAKNRSPSSLPFSRLIVCSCIGSLRKYANRLIQPARTNTIPRNTFSAVRSS